MTASRPTRSTTASSCPSSAPSPCRTPARTSSSASSPDLNCRVCYRLFASLFDFSIINIHDGVFDQNTSFVRFRYLKTSYCWGSPSCLQTFPLPSSEPTDNANVSFVTYKGDYYVSTETNIMHKVDPETLKTTKKVRRALKPWTD